MTRSYDVAAMAAELRARSRRSQGLPAQVEDPVVLDRLADLLDPAPRGDRRVS